ncbi:MULTISPECIES: hypothetical protein [Nostoc]|uniref:Uncharacterized protein n=1 Tax=Nostoc paludosum FACHB-159 TaxID=2692908 RepID=A0ABR8K943_9NOSO|nr:MULTISPECIES: hypothetical protein [Nostoc]MBD2679749.1 hypothetical protein [Nostoc sp. FACHB-857]MBD2735995.1 hypothetical protein [Nostoc paludosum FACHB-159]
MKRIFKFLSLFIASVLSILLLVSLVADAHWDGYADDDYGSYNSYKLPYNSDFPKAYYPYAQRPDGCSLPWEEPGLHDKFQFGSYEANFRPACYEHDKCFYTIGSSFDECSRNFYAATRAACEKAAGESPVTTFFSGGISVATCYTWATSTFGAVWSDGGWTAFRAAQNMQHRYMAWVNSILNSSKNSPVGYFDNGATVFYSDGNTHCGFVSETHLSFYQKVISVPNLGRQDPNNFGAYTGACVMPTGYFENGGTVYFSAGNGSFCGFPSGEAFDSHRRSRPQETLWGRLDVAPSKFLTYTGVCE